MKSIIYILFSVSVFLAISVEAKTKAKTNINEVTNLFDKNIENKQELFKLFEDTNNNVKQNLQHSKNGILNEVMDANEAITQTNNLQSIDATELENAGRAKRKSKEYEFYDENNLEPNYTKPGNKKHKEDALDIIEDTDAAMSDKDKNGNTKPGFMSALKKYNIECETKKGSIIKEPVHIIKKNNKKLQNSDYKLHLCEELSNKYKCTKKLNMKCKDTAIDWDKQKNHIVTIPVGALVNNYNLVRWDSRRIVIGTKTVGVGWNRKTKNVTQEQSTLKLKFNHSAWRSFLAKFLEIPEREIHPQIHFPDGENGIGGAYSYGNFAASYQLGWGGFGNRNTGSVGLLESVDTTDQPRQLIFGNYRVQINVAPEKCVKWDEEWVETCRLDK